MTQQARFCPKCQAPVVTGNGTVGAYVYCENPRCDFFQKDSHPTQVSWPPKEDNRNVSPADDDIDFE